jgi:hypothetical protein
MSDCYVSAADYDRYFKDDPMIEVTIEPRDVFRLLDEYAEHRKRFAQRDGPEPPADEPLTLVETRISQRMGEIAALEHELFQLQDQAAGLRPAIEAQRVIDNLATLVRELCDLVGPNLAGDMDKPAVRAVVRVMADALGEGEHVTW